MRAALAMLAVAAAAGSAAAQAKRRVLVESDPPGADVYLNSKDDGSLCKTPCTIDAPVGDSPIIVELANHLTAVENLVIPRRGRPTLAKFKLVPAVGTLVVTGPKGATVKVGDVDRGSVPAKFDIEAGPYMVVLFFDGKQIDSQPVEVSPGEEVTVASAAKVATAEPTVDDTTSDDRPTSGDVTKRGEPSRPRQGKLFSLAAVFDIGFRNFDYENADSDKLREEDESGQVIGGGALEVWPGNLARVHALRGLSVYFRLQFPINEQPVRSTDGAITGNTTTFWQSFEATARHRWAIASRYGLEVHAGFARDYYQFNTDSMDAVDIDYVPDAVYDAVKLGVRGAVTTGVFEPYATLGYRLVLSGGVLEDRFDSASATGLHAAAGVRAVLGPIEMRVEGSITRYAWTFKYDSIDEFKADGATDQIKLISAGLGYAY